MPERLAHAWAHEGERYRPTRRDGVFLVLAGIFLTDALLGELTGGNLIEVGGVMSIGVIPWPLVFVVTDLINEYYGPRAVRRLTLLAAILNVCAFMVLPMCMRIPAAPFSPVNDATFDTVFGRSLWIIVGSVTAVVAVPTLPLIYAGHVAVEKYLEAKHSSSDQVTA